MSSNPNSLSPSFSAHRILLVLCLLSSPIGGEALARGAKALEEYDGDTAITMYLEALDLFEEVGYRRMVIIWAVEWK